MTSQDTDWVRLPDGRAAASACRSRLTRSLWWLPSSSGRTARGRGATGRGLGVLGVGGAFVQYAQLLVSGSRPSWRRPTRGKTRANSGRGRSRTMTTGPQRRGRAGNGGGEPVTEAPGYAVRTPDSLLRGLVPTAPPRAQSAPGPRTLEEAARPRRPPCAPRVRGGSGPDGAPASLGVPAGHRARC